MTALLVDHVIELIGMHEANALVLYSNMLSGQIPRSYAANAFRRFQTSMAGFEVIRLCACWQVPDLNDASVPNVLDLIAPAEVRAVLSAEVGASAHLSIHAAIVAQLEQHLDQATVRSAAVKADLRFDAVLNHRNRYLAHNLVRTRLEERTTVDRMRHGDERWLLEETRIIADCLHHGLNRTAFDWEGAQALAQRNAEYLWKGCRFTDLR
jgi:hypothetical protein